MQTNTFKQEQKILANDLQNRFMNSQKGYENVFNNISHQENSN